MFSKLNFVSERLICLSDRGRPRPQCIAGLNVNSHGLDHYERIVRAARSLAGEGARGPSVNVEWGLVAA